ncbi:MAG: hypothetical protein WKF93_02145 [Acidimicrobiales bacterium]
MPPMKGKWAQGIRPRNFAWIITGRLAVCERPGGYGANHRRVRRQEEIIWIREQGFTKVISLIPSSHNLHNYDELGVGWLHRPYRAQDPLRPTLVALLPELRALLAAGEQVLVHRDELGDPVQGLVAAFLRWSGVLADGPGAVTVIERLVQRQLGPIGREMVEIAGNLPPDLPVPVVPAAVLPVGPDDADVAGEAAAPDVG